MKKIIILSIVIIGLLSFKAADDYFEVSKNLEIFSNVYKELHNSYVDEIKPGEFFKTGIDAMMSSLDPYTVFYTESQAEEAMIQRQGEYGGIGCNSSKRESHIVITNVMEGMPADLAGLKVGDKILEINGKNYVNKSIDETSLAIKGAPNTKFTMLVDRNGEKINLEITRQEIKSKNVPYFGMIDNQIGYIKLNQFMIGSADEVRNAVVELKSKGAKNIILDLRFNGGGLLQDAINIVNIFVDNNITIATTKGRNITKSYEYKSLYKPVDNQIPLIILVNERSASASEVVSGAIQDLDRGIILGTNTFGKGIVQETKNLPYRTQMKFTISKYYIPSGRCIQKFDHSSKALVIDSTKEQIKYKTKNGRIVYEGNGIKPDQTINNNKGEVMKKIENSDLIFDFCTQLIYDKKLLNSKTYQITDTDFETFKKYVALNSDKIKLLSENSLKSFEDKLKAEGLLDANKEELKKLKDNINQQKIDEIEKNKSLVIFILESEIIRRLAYEKGLIEFSFKNDPYIQKAKQLFANTQEMNEILNKK